MTEKHEEEIGSEEQGELSVNDLAEMIKKLQMQMTFIEKKIDLLIEEKIDRPNQEKSFAESSRPFSRPSWGGRDRGGEGRREGGFAPRRHFDRPSGNRRDEAPREGGFAPRRRFDGPSGGEGHGGFRSRKPKPFGRRRHD